MRRVGNSAGEHLKRGSSLPGESQEETGVDKAAGSLRKVLLDSGLGMEPALNMAK